MRLPAGMRAEARHARQWRTRHVFSRGGGVERFSPLSKIFHGARDSTHCRPANTRTVNTPHTLGVWGGVDTNRSICGSTRDVCVRRMRNVGKQP